MRVHPARAMTQGNGRSGAPDSEPLTVVLTVNSPGEVAGWLTPVVRALRAEARGQKAQVVVFIPPCTFAAGTEPEVVRRIPGVDVAVPPGGVLRYLMAGLRPAGFSPGARGVLIFLGGDMFYGAALARRLGYPALAYTAGRAAWPGIYQRFLVPDAAARQRALARSGGRLPQERVAVVGDLLVDAVLGGAMAGGAESVGAGGPARGAGAAGAAGAVGAAGRAPARRRGEGAGPVIGLFPGSRSYELSHVLPLMLGAVTRLAAGGLPGSAIVALSPFAPEAALEEGIRRAGWSWSQGPQVRQRIAAGAGEAGHLVPPERCNFEVRVVKGDPHGVMRQSDVAVTVPGTNTAEMAVLGLPAVVVLPLDRPELVPLEGVAGWLGALPGLGRPLKRAAVLRAARRYPFVALPNMRAGRLIMPELKGRVSADALAGEVAALLADEARRRRMGEELRKVVGPPGAAAAVWRHALELVDASFWG